MTDPKPTTIESSWPWVLAGMKTYLETGRQMAGSGS
jgi:hypothetical protein